VPIILVPQGSRPLNRGKSLFPGLNAWKTKVFWKTRKESKRRPPLHGRSLSLSKERSEKRCLLGSWIPGLCAPDAIAEEGVALMLNKKGGKLLQKKRCPNLMGRKTPRSSRRSAAFGLLCTMCVPGRKKKSSKAEKGQQFKEGKKGPGVLPVRRRPGPHHFAGTHPNRMT